MLDLFCGRFGWGKAFAARGWEVVGVDLVEPPEIPQGCTFISADILSLRYSPSIGFYFVDGPVLGFFDAVCASSPCEEFSVHGIKCFHPNPPFPDLGLVLFCHTRRLLKCSEVPYVMENVRAAQQFVGDASHHCGPFYLWGSAVPALMVQGVSKGTKFGLDRDGSRASRKQNDPYYRTGSRSKQRADYRAQIATIPPELASCVADYAARILEPQCA